MSVITISREAGSLGDEIANLLAEELNYKLLDPDKIKDVLSIKGVERPVIEQFDEKNPGFFSHFSENREKFLNYLSLSVFEESRTNGLVILGLGGQFLFSSQEAVVRVRITAPFDLRVTRIIEKYKCDEKNARRLIQHIDHDREGYQKSFFHNDIYNNNAYDLLINTEYIAIENAIDLINNVCNFKNQLAFNFKDNYIKHKLIINILYERKIPVKNLFISYEKGQMILDGRTNSVENVELCTLAAKEIDGVEEIHNRITHKALNNYSIH